MVLKFFKWLVNPLVRYIDYLFCHQSSVPLLLNMLVILVIIPVSILLHAENAIKKECNAKGGVVLHGDTHLCIDRKVLK